LWASAGWFHTHRITGASEAIVAGNLIELTLSGNAGVVGTGLSVIADFFSVDAVSGSFVASIVGTSIQIVTDFVHKNTSGGIVTY